MELDKNILKDMVDKAFAGHPGPAIAQFRPPPRLKSTVKRVARAQSRPHGSVRLEMFSHTRMCFLVRKRVQFRTCQRLHSSVRVARTDRTRLSACQAVLGHAILDERTSHSLWVANKELSLSKVSCTISWGPAESGFPEVRVSRRKRRMRSRGRRSDPA